MSFLKNVVVQHIPHQYSAEVKSPTETVSLFWFMYYTYRKLDMIGIC